MLAALRRGRVVRLVDRLEAFSAVGCLALVILAFQPVSAFAHEVYATNSVAYAKEAANRHTVDAVALASSQTAVRGMGAAYQVHVQWFANNETRDKVVRIDRALAAGDHIPLWLDEEGAATTAPRTDSDARTDAIGVATILVGLAVIAGLATLALLRSVLDRARYRAWDREWQAFADNDGGWATRNS